MVLDILIVGIVIGFVFGYFSSTWLWTKKVADLLDKMLKKTKDTQ